MPARLGHNAALDAAVSCLCLIYFERTPATAYSMHKDIYQSYAKALGSLRGCLEEGNERQMEAETLCASIILQMCEVSFPPSNHILRSSANRIHVPPQLVVNIDTGKWSQLASGTRHLIQVRGVGRYQSAFEYAMLESQLIFVVCAL